MRDIEGKHLSNAGAVHAGLNHEIYIGRSQMAAGIDRQYFPSAMEFP
ncbi:uncharacterized protein BCN122_II0063 [Burkholderia cenocepacia]|nr:uncharacterized protein BCN122_II0063 [Burkholderia cenocepacia]